MGKFEDKNGLIEILIEGGKTTKLTKPINLRNFYMDLHDLLVKEGFKDMLGTKKDISNGKFLGNWAKKGEFVDNKGNLNRTGDMFEKSYTLITHEKGKTIQIVWQAFKKTPYGDQGWVEFKLDVQSPFMSDREILDGNNKIVLQSGTFEFRNSIIYKNLVVRKYLNNIPFVKNSSFLKDFYLNNIFKSSLENDIEYCEIKVKDKINKLIGKYFQ